MAGPEKGGKRGEIIHKHEQPMWSLKGRECSPPPLNTSAMQAIHTKA